MLLEIFFYNLFTDFYKFAVGIFFVILSVFIFVFFYLKVLGYVKWFCKTNMRHYLDQICTKILFTTFVYGVGVLF